MANALTKGSIYHCKTGARQSFSMEVDQPEIGRLMEVSIMFDIGTYCVFTLYGRPGYRHTEEETAQLLLDGQCSNGTLGSSHCGHYFFIIDFIITFC